MKSITSKTNNQNLDRDKYFHKSSASLKHLSSQKKPKKGKYLNYIESNKKGREVMEHINIVPLNGYIRYSSYNIAIRAPSSATAAIKILFSIFNFVNL